MDSFLGSRARKLLNISLVSYMVIRSRPTVEAVDGD